jgi:hypothetical protein
VGPFSEVWTGALVGGSEGASADASTSISVVEAAGLLSFMMSGFGEGSDNISDAAETLCTGTGSSPLIALIVVEKLTVVDIMGSSAFRPPFTWVTLMGKVAERSVALLTTVMLMSVTEG